MFGLIEPAPQRLGIAELGAGFTRVLHVALAEGKMCSRPQSSVWANAPLP
jgi:hypothetical protein